MSKKIEIVLIGHGKIGSGVLSSLKLIYGDAQNVTSIDTYVEKDFNLVDTAHNLIEKNKSNELIVVTDLFGGSVNNEFLKYTSGSNVYLITGMNLALVLDLVSKVDMRQNESVEEIVKSVVSNVKDSIKYCDDNLINSSIQKDDDF